MAEKFGETENDYLYLSQSSFPSSATSKRNIQLKQMFAVLSGKRKHVLEFMAEKFG